jgi:hypothetical protein
MPARVAIRIVGQQRAAAAQTGWWSHYSCG